MFLQGNVIGLWCGVFIYQFRQLSYGKNYSENQAVRWVRKVLLVVA